MASGKTTVGRLLAERLSYEFIDLDTEIERQAGVSVADLFRQDGEPHFRELEHAALERVGDRDDVVIATGGGTVVFERNRDLIAATGTSIWLHPPFSVLARRLAEADDEIRPLAGKSDEMAALYKSRLEAYQGADVIWVVEAEELPNQTVDGLIERLMETT